MSTRSSRRKKRRKTKYKKKKMSQLFNLTAKIADFLSLLKIKKKSGKVFHKLSLVIFYCIMKLV